MSDYFNLLSGRYKKDVPPEKAYLTKYFKPGVQLDFLKYFLSGGKLSYFRDHMGYDYSKRWLEKLRLRIVMLTKLHDDAQKNMDFEALFNLKQGKLDICKVDIMSKSKVWVDFLTKENK